MRFLVVYILCCGGHATRLSLWNLLMNKLYGSDSQQLVHLLLESLVWQQVTYQKITQKRIPFSYPFFSYVSEWYLVSFSVDGFSSKSPSFFFVLNLFLLETGEDAGAV